MELGETYIESVTGVEKFWQAQNTANGVKRTTERKFTVRYDTSNRMLHVERTK